MNKNENEQKVENSKKWKNEINEKSLKYSNQQREKKQTGFFKSRTDNQWTCKFLRYVYTIYFCDMFL